MIALTALPSEGFGVTQPHFDGFNKSILIRAHKLHYLCASSFLLARQTRLCSLLAKEGKSELGYGKVTLVVAETGW